MNLSTRHMLCLVVIALRFGADLSLTAADHWAFQPIIPATIPDVNEAEAWSHNPIDAFVLARLNAAGFSPAKMTDRTTLIRRVSLDLVGLPPTREERDEFLHETRPDAYERVIDRLLASPHYGERWARLWLDLCHYGDTDGHLTDQLRPFAWRYRDWVIQSLNENLPFDEFTLFQLAGDLISRRDEGEPIRDHDPVLGTGFLRQTLSNREGGADLEEYRVEQVVDRTSLVGTTWLGLTVGCARCHDHKYDPVTQAEFYQLYAFFDRAEEINLDAPLAAEREAYLKARPEYERRRRDTMAPFAEALEALQKQWEQKLLYAMGHPGEDHVWDRQWELLGLIWGGGLGEGQLEGTEIVKLPWLRRSPRQQDDLVDYFLERGSVTDEKQFTAARLGELRQQLVAIRKSLPQAVVTRAPVMRGSSSPRPTHVHERGDFRSRGQEVSPAPLGGFLSQQPVLPPAIADRKQGEWTRRDLAVWLMSPGNPLPARVTVNRMWQEFFGRGIVATSDDFGTRGARPSHPELIDWLASEYLQSGWNTKSIHRKLVSSACYCQSSLPRADLQRGDPDNRLLARQVSLRVSAEVVRDVTLATSGLLSTTLGGPGVYPLQDERVTKEAYGSNTWKTSHGDDRYRRSIYTFIQRTSPFAQSITFDAPSPARVCSRRDRSNTPLQALTLLNDPAFHELSRNFAEILLKPPGLTDRERVELAVEQGLLREGSQDEIDRLVGFVEQHRTAAGNPINDESERVLWTDLASILMNLHEFIVRD